MNKKDTPTLIFVALALFVALGIGSSFFGSEKVPDGTVPLKPPAIGGPFELVDHTSRTVTDKDFHSKYLLIFFGYIYCPDVCSTAVITISDALDILGPDMANKITPVFVSVDHERDTPESLREYVGQFSPRFVGMTGTKKQISQVAKAYNVYFAKSEEPGGNAENYFMDHSAITYLMGPDGKFIRHFPYGIDPKNMADQIKKILG